jgi:F-type H+-transporting ATPase subunit b
MIELWLLVSLIILIALIYKPLTRAIFGALDGHAAKVRAELDQAKRLREEAQHLLAEHQRQLASGQDQATAIVEQARREAERQTDRQRRELESSLERRAEQALDRIAQEEARALQEVRGYAASLAVRTTERLLRDHINEVQAKALLDDAIGEVGRKLG